uniref:Uncharacterized protein n=1 Tax=Globisporangium ultimum (strain ATCC 200006 / CBS 805.95 / DAOM BR144) TaxID=431595 RepID=K3XBR2_GLOUD
MPPRFLTPACVAALALCAASSVSASATCCDACLAQTDSTHSVLTYDPLVYVQCAGVQGICCFECDFAHGSVVFGDGVTYDDDASAPVATVGTPMTFTFNGIARVTYDFLRANQKKTSFVGNRSTQAAKSGDVFSICVTQPGTIALRGWGTDSCRQVTTETTVTVQAAANGTTVGNCQTTPAAATVKPTDTDSSNTSSNGASKTPTPNQSVGSLDTNGVSTSGKYDTANCNLNRGSVITSVDGTKVCECAGDWRNPPACDEYSWTKTILTIAGAVATVLSIAISVRAYLKSRKSKSAAAEAVELDDRVSAEVLRIDQRSPPLTSINGNNVTPMPAAARASPATTRVNNRSPTDMTRVKTGNIM